MTDNKQGRGMKTSKISRILTAIDGSHSSMEAARYALAMAKKYDAELFSLTIINTQPWFYSSTLYGWAFFRKLWKRYMRAIYIGHKHG